MNAAAIALNRFGLGATPDRAGAGRSAALAAFAVRRYEPLPAPWKPLPRTPGSAGGLARAAARRTPGARGPKSRHSRGVPPPGSRGLRGGRRRTRQQRAADLHPVRRAAGALLVQPLRGLGRQAARGRPGRRLRGRRDPPTCARPLRGPAARRRAPSGDAAVPGPGAVDRPAQLARHARGENRQLRGRGLNENLAREILELHTLGVRSGYTQDGRDRVRACADGLDAPRPTTWRWRRDDVPFRARPARAWRQDTCSAAAMPNGGEQQARDIIHDLVTSPATARHIARKLARHFVADEPPPALVRTAGERLLAHRRRPGQRVPRAGGLAGGVAAGGRQVQVAMGLGDLEPSRAGRQELPATQAANLHEPARPAGVAAQARRPATTTWPPPGPHPMRCCAASRWRSASPCRPATRSMHARSRRACCLARWARTRRPPSPAPKTARRARPAAGLARVPEEMRMTPRPTQFPRRRRAVLGCRRSCSRRPPPSGASSSSSSAARPTA